MDGKIERRVRKDGTIAYSQRVEGPADPETGKRQRVRVTADTEKELRAKSRQAIRELEDGIRVKRSGETFEAFATWWMESIVEPTSRPATIDVYWADLRKFVFPAIGHRPLQEIDYRALHRMQRDLLKREKRGGGTLAPATVRVAMVVTRRIFAEAVRLRILSRNPMDLVQLPRAETAPVKIWTIAQAIAFLDAAARDELHPYWSIAVLTGMRPGEMLGLRWSEIDLDQGTIRVERTRTYTALGRQVEGPPKTNASRRTIDLSPELVETLRTLRLARIEAALAGGSGWRPHEEYVVVRTGGTPPSRTMVLDHFHALIDQTGVPAIRLHGLRHVHASLLLQVGVHPKAIQERLGHANVSMTLGIYAHVLPSGHRTAANDLGEALFGGGRNSSMEEQDDGLSDAL